MNTFSQKAHHYLQILSEEYPSRRVGSPANQAATKFFRQTIHEMGLQSTSQRFDCFDHQTGKMALLAGRKSFDAHISPHSLGCNLKTELDTASNIEELRSRSFEGKILLLLGEITKEQLMPKNFSFYNPESHQEIYSLLEAQQPAAIITATGKNPGLAGAPYPFPLIEDGDFDIPSAYMKDIEGEKLLEHAGKIVTLTMDAERIPSWAENISVCLGDTNSDRVVFCAHIDSKHGTPGAVDNACGVVTLLLLADLLKEEKAVPAIELVPFNGEDHYSVKGEMVYLQENKDQMDKIKLVINIDGAGYRDHISEVSFYSCPEDLERCAKNRLNDYTSIQQGEPWPQSDHMIFAMQQIPAMAITTSAFIEMEREIAHTPKDSPDMVDTTLLVDIAHYLRDFVMQCMESEDI